MKDPEKTQDPAGSVRVHVHCVYYEQRDLVGGTVYIVVFSLFHSLLLFGQIHRHIPEGPLVTDVAQLLATFLLM